MSYSNFWKPCQIYRFSIWEDMFYLQISLNLFPPSDIPLFSNSSLKFGYAPLKEPPTAGLAGLEKLSIFWDVYDNPNEPGSSLVHFYEFIRPTLTTLVNLNIEIVSTKKDFDLQLLKPAADTLRTFKYSLLSADDSILDTIPAILPHLTNLNIFWCRNVLWKDAHIQALSKIKNLTVLKLSLNLEDFAWFVRYYKRSLKATQDISSACPRLQQCSWVLPGILMTHSFIVEERMTGGNVTQVVRGIKQPWMGRDWLTETGIVNCKLEDLPGDIIGQNDE